MSEHRGREASKQMGPAQFLDLFILLELFSGELLLKAAHGT